MSRPARRTDRPVQHHYLEIMRYNPPGHDIRWWAQCSCGYKGEARSVIGEAESDRSEHASRYWAKGVVHL